MSLSYPTARANVGRKDKIDAGKLYKGDAMQKGGNL
jgi:hypothetical protein